MKRILRSSAQVFVRRRVRWSPIQCLLHSRRPPAGTQRSWRRERLRQLLQYEFKIAFDQINHDELETNPDNYSLLRKGLGEYFELYIKEMFIDTYRQYHSKVEPAWQAPDNFRMLDIGCGNGAYSVALHNAFRNIDFTLIESSSWLLK